MTPGLENIALNQNIIVKPPSARFVYMIQSSGQIGNKKRSKMTYTARNISIETAGIVLDFSVFFNVFLNIRQSHLLSSSKAAESSLFRPALAFFKLSIKS